MLLILLLKTLLKSVITEDSGVFNAGILYNNSCVVKSFAVSQMTLLLEILETLDYQFQDI